MTTTPPQSEPEGQSNAATGDRPSGHTAMGGDRDMYDDSSLPILKRTWFWLLAGLLILVSGIIIGLALARLFAPEPVVRRVDAPPGPRHAEASAIETKRRRLFRRVADLQGRLAGDLCRADQASYEGADSVTGQVREDAALAPVVPPLTPPTSESIGDTASLTPGGAPAASGNGAADGAAEKAPANGTASNQPDGAKQPASPANREQAGQSGETPGEAAKSGAQDGTASSPDPASDAETPPGGNTANDRSGSTENQDQQQSSAQSGKPTTFRDVLGPATLLVIAKNGRRVATGSGFLISPRHVVTNAHVVAEGTGRVSVLNRTLNAKRGARVVGKQWQKGVLGGGRLCRVGIVSADHEHQASAAVGEV